MSTSARASQLVKAPVQVFGIEGRYAHALYSAATKSKKLDAVEKDMQKLEGFMASDAKFAQFVKDPSMKRTQKKCKSLGIRIIHQSESNKKLWRYRYLELKYGDK